MEEAGDTPKPKQSRGSMVTVTKVMFKEAENSSTDSDDVLFCESPELDND